MKRTLQILIIIVSLQGSNALSATDNCSLETLQVARQHLQAFEFQRVIDLLKDLRCGIVSDLVLFMKAEAFMALSPEDARKTYEELIHTCKLQPCSPLLVRRAKASLIELLLLEDRAQAIKELERYVERYPFDDYSTYLLAYLKERDGHDPSSLYKRLFIKNSNLSSLIKERIDYRMLSHEEFEEKIKGLFGLLRYDEAELAIKRRLEEEGDPLRIEDLRRLLGNLYFKKKRYREAAKEFLLSKEYYMLGLSELRAGNYEEAKKVIDRLIKARDRRVIPLAIAYARTLRDRGDHGEVINYLEGLLRYFPFDSEEIQWAIAWTHYRIGNYERAKDQLLELKKKYKKPRYDYWLLRLAEIEDQRTDLFQGYRRLLKEDSGFYSFLARKRLEKLEGKKLRGASEPVILPSLTDSCEYNVSSAYQPLFRRFSIFLKLGLRDELNEEIKALVKDCIKEAPSWELPFIFQEVSSNPHKPDLKEAQSSYCKEILKNIGFFFYSTGQYHRAVALYSRLKRLPEIGRIDDRLLYPIIYPELILRVSRLYGVDPYLLLSIIREESRYNPEAISPAGAIGLMQIMPSVAETLIKGASRGVLPVKNNLAPSQGLYDPELNIHLGALYLKRLLEKYKEIPLVVAAYNAGERAVDSWLRNNYSSMDEFIEDIPYGETINYVKRVLTTYEKYLRLYGDHRKLPSMDRRSCNLYDETLFTLP